MVSQESRTKRSKCSWIWVMVAQKVPTDMAAWWVTLDRWQLLQPRAIGFDIWQHITLDYILSVAFASYLSSAGPSILDKKKTQWIPATIDSLLEGCSKRDTRCFTEHFLEPSKFVMNWLLNSLWFCPKESLWVMLVLLMHYVWTFWKKFDTIGSW